MRETARGWNYADVWELIAKAIPNSPAIIQNAQRISWRQFDEDSSSLAALLEKNGIRPGDKVAQYLQNCPEYLQAVFACFKAGYVPVNTNYRYAEEEIVYLWDNADARAVIFQGQFATLIENVRGRLPWIVAWLWVDDGSGPCPSWAESVTDAGKSSPMSSRTSWWRRPRFYLYRWHDRQPQGGDVAPRRSISCVVEHLGSSCPRGVRC